MPYIVRIMLSQEAWEQALIEVTPHIGHYVTNLDTLAPAEQAGVLRTVMKVALARHHQWLEDRGIGAIISPTEASEQAFSFEFTCWSDALLFQQKFHGKLLDQFFSH